MAKISPARKAAFDILMTVARGRAHSDTLLRGKAVDALSPADRNLATALVLGVLRWQIRLDWQLKGYLKKPGARLDAEILIALRLGAFQLLFLDRIPAHAAINESVELAKRAGHAYAARMVNVVLRKLGSWAGENRASITTLHQGGTLAAPKLQPNEAGALSPAAELALAEAHPAWMVERWAELYGMEAARAICGHGQSEPAEVVRLEDPAAEAELASAGVELAAGELLDAARIVESGDVVAMPAFQAGRVRMQDEGSQLIGEIAACAAGSAGEEAKHFLDLCAAPGGKTLILAGRNPRARIVACEASAQRLTLLRERLAACGDRVECRLADAAAIEERDHFDAVLADVPCSGTGTLGRNPEIRHRLHVEDLLRQAGRQRAILHAALRAVRPGGCVVYSTCSLEPEENERVVNTVLEENSRARVVPIGSQIEMLEKRGVLAPAGAERLRSCITHEGALRLLPGAFHSDGFFVALLERTA